MSKVELKVRLTFTTELLGTSSANKEIHRDYIASKAPDAETREQEIARIGAAEYEEKSMTVFPRLDDGTPFIWGYQFKGLCKDAASMLQKCRVGGKKGKPEDFAKNTCAITAYKKVIDGLIFTKEREIPIHVNGEIGNLQRPLRGQTAQGERIALANSEMIPAGSWIEFTIVILTETYLPAVIEWLEYGQYRGFLQWRNAGFGCYSYEIIEQKHE